MRVKCYYDYYFCTMEIMGMDRWDSFVEFLDDIKDEYYYKQVSDSRVAFKSSGKSAFVRMPLSRPIASVFFP